MQAPPHRARLPLECCALGYWPLLPSRWRNIDLVFSPWGLGLKAPYGGSRSLACSQLVSSEGSLWRSSWHLLSWAMYHQRYVGSGQLLFFSL